MIDFSTKKIVQLSYNWHQEGGDGDIGENEYMVRVGKNGVTEILEHQARGEGDKWHYDIVFDSGRIERIFNPNGAIFENDNKAIAEMDENALNQPF